MIANAIIDIWRAEGVFPVPKYEDDLKVFRIPSPMGIFHDGDFSYNYDHTEMLWHIALLGIPWHDEKGDDHFLFITTFIRFCCDIPGKLVSLPNDKCLKFHEHVRRFLNDFKGLPFLLFHPHFFLNLLFKGRPCHLLDIGKIHGSLCHVAFVYLDSCSCLPSLSNFASSFHNNKLITWYPPHHVIQSHLVASKTRRQQCHRHLVPSWPSPRSSFIVIGMGNPQVTLQ